MASTYLTRATSDPQSSNTTATFSVWIKRNSLSSDQSFWGGSYYSTDNMFIIKFSSDDKLQVYSKRGASLKASLKTTRVLRDTNAWYHIVVAIDTTQGTSADRIKVYINGVQETSFSTNTQPSQNENLYLDSGAGANYYIGQRGGNAEYFDGLMSHFHYVDGSQLEPTVFGLTDTNGVWTIKTSPSYTVGTKGFFVLKDGNSGTDQSANSNNFTVGGGTLTNTEDNPSNVFATMATPTWYDGTIANGGNTVTTNQSNYRYQAASLGVSSGKWYWEAKLSTAASWGLIGITDQPTYQTGSTNIFGSAAYDYAVYYGSDGSTASGGGHLFNNAGASPGNTPGGFMGAISQGDIFTFALDLDSATKKLYIGTNGNWSNGSNATDQTFANSTGKTITTPSSTNTGFYFPAVGDYAGSSTSVFQFNFGNGYFGTTAVSSAGTNASGIGIFEYDVPTGYTALSTKGLNL